MCREARIRHMELHMKKVLPIISPERILVAADPQEEDVIYGWVCFEPGTKILHYVYTTDGFRRMGIAQGLMALAGVLGDDRVQISHYNWRIKRLFKHLKQNWDYNPYLLEAS